MGTELCSTANHSGWLLALVILFSYDKSITFHPIEKRFFYTVYIGCMPVKGMHTDKIPCVRYIPVDGSYTEIKNFQASYIFCNVCMPVDGYTLYSLPVLDARRRILYLYLGRMSVYGYPIYYLPELDDSRVILLYLC